MLVLLLFSSPHSFSTGSEDWNGHHCALGRYRHTSSSRQFHNIFCWLDNLNYCPDDGNGHFHCSSCFLKTTSLILLHIRNILFVFSHRDGWLREFGLCFPSYLYFCETGSHGWIISCSYSPWVLKIVNMNGNILQRYFTHKNFYGCQ